MSELILTQAAPPVLSVEDELRLVPLRARRGRDLHARLTLQPTPALEALVAAGFTAPIDSPAEQTARVAKLILAVRKAGEE